MPSIGQRCRKLLERAKKSEATYPKALRIPMTAVDSPSTQALSSDNCYFGIRLNQMRLASKRKWWTDIYPMALVVSEFYYAGERVTVPFVVGPSMLGSYGYDMPRDMLFENTLVAGVHPYKGGSISLTAVLFAVPSSNHARTLLSLAEGATGLFGLGAQIGTYLKVADVILDGVEAVLGLDGVEPVAGRRLEITPDLGDDLGSGYFVLGDDDLPAQTLGVEQHRLVDRDGATGQARDVEGSDFLLYSLVAIPGRTDLEQFSFDRLIKEAYRQALTDGSAGGWKRAKALFVTAGVEIVDSPDLITSQGDMLRSSVQERLLALRAEALATSALAPGDEDPRATRLADLAAFMDQ
jgi:hypothetical protein